MFDNLRGKLRLPGLILLTLLAWVLLGPVTAQQTATQPQTRQQSRLADKKLGEEEQIQKRGEWFFSQRREGLAPDEQMWRLRLEAVEQTRLAIEPVDS